MVQSICGCKWSLTVYWLLSQGIDRPGAMVRAVDGLSTKVLNDCLRRNVDLGILERVAHAEVPPRVEYRATELGSKFIAIMGQLEQLQSEIDQTL